MNMGDGQPALSISGDGQPALSIEERLRLDTWTEEQIQAALQETLPVGWSAVRDEAGEGVYWWNEVTDQTTWLKPVAPAIEPANVDAASLGATRPLSARVLTSPSSAAGGASTIHWPPLPDRRERSWEPLRTPSRRPTTPRLMNLAQRFPSLRSGATRPLPTPADLLVPAPGQTAQRIQQAARNVELASTALNLVLERVGKREKPPPPPMTTKHRLLMHYRENDPSFSEDTWQWRQGRWTHLPPPPRIMREEVSATRVPTVWPWNITRGDVHRLQRLVCATQVRLRRADGSKDPPHTYSPSKDDTYSTARPPASVTAGGRARMA